LARGSVRRAARRGDAPASGAAAASVAAAAELDVLDIAILCELQNNGRISKNELAFRVGVSPPQ
jgi:hypothetical protein